jgi:hypothetical protein
LTIWLWLAVVGVVLMLVVVAVLAAFLLALG